MKTTLKWVGIGVLCLLAWMYYESMSPERQKESGWALLVAGSVWLVLHELGEHKKAQDRRFDFLTRRLDHLEQLHRALPYEVVDALQRERRKD